MKHIRNLYDKLATALKASHFKAMVELNSTVTVSDLSFYNNDNADSSVYYNKKVMMRISVAHSKTAPDYYKMTTALFLFCYLIS